MASQSKNFISLVALGGQNPQILNVDFLKANKMVPSDEPPFNELFQQEKPFTKFISTPVFSNLVLGPIEFIVDEQRFQIRDTSINNWTDTKILYIAQNYYDTLRYTPLKMVGINFNSEITFATSKESMSFQQLFLPESSQVLGIISNSDISANIVLRYRYSDNGARVTLTINPPNKANDKRIINFNYEFDFIDWPNFKSELTKMPEIAKYYESILDQLLKAI